MDKQRGFVLGMDVADVALTPGEAGGRRLVKALLMGTTLAEKIRIGRTRLQSGPQPLCDEFGIGLSPAPSLPVLQKTRGNLEPTSDGRRRHWPVVAPLQRSA